METMSAEVLGKRLLDEVKEEGLDEVRDMPATPRKNDSR
jgi:hypothetical protein